MFNTFVTVMIVRYLYVKLNSNLNIILLLFAIRKYLPEGNVRFFNILRKFCSVDICGVFHDV